MKTQGHIQQRIMQEKYWIKAVLPHLPSGFHSFCSLQNGLNDKKKHFSEKLKWKGL